MTLDAADLRMALHALAYYRSAYGYLKRPVPPGAERLEEHLQQALAASGQEEVAPQVNWVTTREVMRRCNCSESTAKRIARSVGKKVGRDWMVPADALPEGGGEQP